MELVNLTPHELNIGGEGFALAIPPSGQVARCSQKEERVGSMLVKECNIAITRITFGEVEGLPDPKEGTVYCVSRVVAEACKGLRNDLVIPGPAIRGINGTVIGARGVSVL